MRKFENFLFSMKQFFASLILLLIFGTGVLVWWYQGVKPVSRQTSYKDFLIVKGNSATQIANKLYKEGLIKNSLVFRVYVKLTNNQGKIQAGEYNLTPSFSLFRIVEELIKGPKEIWITIPEGYRREEIAEKFAQALESKEPEAFIQEFLTTSKKDEGFLFPDTYLFPKVASPSAVVKKMRSTFDKKVDSKMQDDILASGHTLNQVITMASIIERETRGQEERPIVAGILYKRLKAGWPLQADATLQYAVANSKLKTPALPSGRQNSKRTDYWEVLTVDDRAIDSTYNTYKHRGLPPTPIANPGLSSIKAAIYPEDSPYWFYLHDASGQIHYAKTIEEHNQNIKKYIK